MSDRGGRLRELVQAFLRRDERADTDELSHDVREVDVSDLPAIEIDFPDDLEEAPHVHVAAGDQAGHVSGHSWHGLGQQGGDAD